ncbi:hypothetical protein A3J78_00265 [Candidatus Beckwithbacteria bacterium RBG_13_35_6]|uniref:DUF5667 domain-containing protein n=1 Tax=Candidatus Beckwithbacteria bacterium RBG_13_35_6 TaxID=1797456 RepID=A0A1F5DCC8_9BACT|nr:MAG: hypothetical protein A3J78_00265 [Candidatus Beckwithbacteria bacterium RBG_13_35_6]
MKKTAKILLILSLLLISFSPIQAQTKTFPVSRCSHRARLDALKQQIETRKQEIKLNIQEKQATMTAKLNDQRKLNITKYFNQMIERLEAVLIKLNQQVSRIESRLAKLKQEDSGLDTKEIEQWIADAKDRLSATNEAILTAKNSLPVILENNDPKAAFADVKALIKEIKAQLQETHRILVHVIGLIKGLKVGQSIPS